MNIAICMSLNSKGSGKRNLKIKFFYKNIIKKRIFNLLANKNLKKNEKVGELVRLG